MIWGCFDDPTQTGWIIAVLEDRLEYESPKTDARASLKIFTTS